MSKRVLQSILVLVFGLFVTACSASFRDHGYMPTDEQLDKVVIGVDTRATLVEVLGHPNTRGVLDDGSWYYISTRIRTYGAFEPEVVDRNLLLISFNGSDQVSNIERFGLEDGRVVTLSRRVTDQPIKSQSFLQQVFGNLGNFNPGDFF